MPTPLIALDWGTTRARAFLVAEDGAVLAKRIADRGIPARRSSSMIRRSSATSLRNARHPGHSGCGS